MEPYYNASLHGLGFEGFLNYTNGLVEGWMATAFLAFIWIAVVFVMSKSEWKMSISVGFASFMVFIIAMIFKLFMDVNSYIIFILAIMVALSIAWAVIDKN